MPRQSKKITVMLHFPEYKWEALAISLEEKGSHLELELEKYLEKMYLKKVSIDVRKYLAGKYKEYEQAALREAESCEPTSDLDSSVGGPF